jgi:hypothetical protein
MLEAEFAVPEREGHIPKLPASSLPVRGFSALCFQGLSDGYARLRSEALARLVPFNKVTAIRQSAPIIAAGRLARNGPKNPRAVGFDSFEKIYPGHTSILNLFSWMHSI